jgi:hypothetical protein
MPFIIDKYLIFIMNYDIDLINLPIITMAALLYHFNPAWPLFFSGLSETQSQQPFELVGLGLESQPEVTPNSTVNNLNTHIYSI